MKLIEVPYIARRFMNFDKMERREKRRGYDLHTYTQTDRATVVMKCTFMRGKE